MNEKTIPLNILRINFSLKSLITYLLIWFLIIPLFTLEAKEPTIVKLRNIVNNSMLEFQIGDFSFFCSAYGVKTLDTLLEEQKSDNECKNAVLDFYKKEPQLHYIADHKLHLKSFYHLEYINKSCLLYAQGETTYSEILLKEGLALVEKGFEDILFLDDFIKAQQDAEMKKKGIFSDPKLFNCLKQLN